MIDRSPVSIPYTALPPAPPGSPLAVEWETYRREVGRLLAEGHEKRFVLIKGQTVMAVLETWEAAREQGLARFPSDPFFIHEVRAEEPLLRIRGVSSPCRS